MAIDADVRIDHLVDEDLLALAQRVGPDDPSLVMRVQKAVSNAAATGASIVVCTCTTIGAAAERTTTDDSFIVTRIDRAMADRAVVLGPNQLVVVALNSSLGPTCELIQESSLSFGIVQVRTLLVDKAWGYFQRGDLKGYFDCVAESVRANLGDANVVVLGQASMAPVVPLLAGLGVEVLSSPSLGVQSAIAALR